MKRDYSKFLDGKNITGEQITAGKIDNGSVFAGWDENNFDGMARGTSPLQMNGRNVLIHDAVAAVDGGRVAGILNPAFWVDSGTNGAAGVVVWRRIRPANVANARKSVMIYAQALTNADGTSTGRYSLFTVEAVRGDADNLTKITVSVSEISKSA